MILFSDFDGTFCPRDDTETFANNLQAVERFRADGNKFVLVTGRSLASLGRGWPDYQNHVDGLILDNGGVCVDQNGKIIFQNAIPQNTITEIVGALSELVPRDGYAFVYYGDLQELPQPSQNVVKLRFWTTSVELSEKATQLVNEKFADVAKAFTAINALVSNIPWMQNQEKFVAFSDVMAHSAGKEKAVREYLRIFNSEDQPIVTVGDEKNDIAMIQEFHGYAMRDSHPDLLAVVEPGHVVGSVAELMAKIS